MPLSLLFNLDIKSILTMLCAILSIALCYFVWENSNLKQEVTIKDLELQQCYANTDELSKYLDKQNKLIKEIQVVRNVVDTTKILEIEVKDATCEAELEAYKYLFKELGK